MKLTDLEPQLIKYVEERVEPGVMIDGITYPDGLKIGYHHVSTFEEADGLCCLCPKCFHTDHHSMICWFAGKVRDDVKPGPGRWTVSGTSFEDMSLSPSVQLLGGCNWHGFIDNGATRDA